MHPAKHIKQSSMCARRKIGTKIKIVWIALVYLIRLPFVLIKSLFLLAFSIIKKAARKTWAAFRIVYRAYRLGVVIFALKVIRRIPTASVSVIESAYFTFARARDLTFESLLASNLFIRVSNTRDLERNFCIFLARALRASRGDFDASNELSDEPVLIQLGDQLKNRAGEETDIELSILAEGEPPDLPTIQNVVQMSKGNVTNMSVYFDKSEFQGDAPALSPRAAMSDEKTHSEIDCLAIDSLPISWVTAHFVDQCGTELVPPHTATVSAGRALIHFITSPSVVVMNFSNGGVDTVDAIVSRWAPVVEEIFATTGEPNKTMGIVVNTLMTSGQLGHIPFDNVVPSSRLGLTYPEIVSAIDQAECYIGVYDRYGATLPGRGTAALLFPDVEDAPFPDHPDQILLPEGCRALRNERDNQLLLLDPPTPELLVKLIRRAKSAAWKW